MPASSTSMSSPIELDNMPINQPVESVLVNPLVSPSKPKRPWGASQVLAKFKGNKLKSPKPVVPESDLIEEEISEEPLPDLWKHLWDMFKDAAHTTEWFGVGLVFFRLRFDHFLDGLGNFISYALLPPMIIHLRLGGYFNWIYKRFELLCLYLKA